MQEITKQSISGTLAKQMFAIGVNVRRLRVRDKMTQEDVAFYLQTNKSTVSAMERGMLDNVTVRSLIKISRSEEHTSELQSQ